MINPSINIHEEHDGSVDDGDYNNKLLQSHQQIHDEKSDDLSLISED